MSMLRIIEVPSYCTVSSEDATQQAAAKVCKTLDNVSSVYTTDHSAAAENGCWLSHECHSKFQS